MRNEHKNHYKPGYDIYRLEDKKTRRMARIMGPVVALVVSVGLWIGLIAFIHWFLNDVM